MFRDEITRNLRHIFGFEKVSFDAPSESFEEDTLFVEIHHCSSRPLANGKISMEANGALVVFTQDEKLPIGFFAKRVEKASKELTDNFFFFDFDTSAANSLARVRNIGERRVRFVYLYDAQFDPSKGHLTSAEFT